MTEEPQTDKATPTKDPQTRERLDLLVHLLQYSDLMPIIIGAHGMGKSTLLDHLTRRADANWRLCQLTVDPGAPTGAVVDAVGDCFGVGLPAGADSAAYLAGRLEPLRRSGQLPVAVIDEAHHVAGADLATLLDLSGRTTAQGEPLLRVLLAGEPALREAITSTALELGAEDKLYTLELSPLDAEQTAGYAYRRLSHYHGRNDVSLSPAQVQTLHRETGGVPGRLNEAIDRLAGRGADRPSPPGATAQPHAAPSGPQSPQTADASASTGEPRQWPRYAAIAGIGVVLGAVLLFQDHINQWFEPGSPAGEPTSQPLALPQDQTPSQPPRADEPPRPPMPPDPAPSQAPDRAESPSEAFAKRAPDRAQGAATDAPVEAADTADDDAAPAGAAQGTQAAPPPPAPERRTADAEPESAPETRPAGAGGSSPTTVTTGEPAPQAETSSGRESAAGPGDDAGEGPGDATQAPAYWSLEVAGVNGVEWLRHQSAQRYTVQLLGVREPERLRRYLQQHTLDGPLAAFETDYDGRPWYVLVSGSYGSRDAARRAMEALPAPVRDNGPWPRTFGSIHQAVADIDG